MRVPAGDVRSPVWDPKSYCYWGKARNYYSSMAELGDKVSGQPRESFRLCVPRIPWESNTNSSGNPTLLCAHEHEHALIGWRHERSPVFRIRRAARTKHETRSTASRALLLFRRTKTATFSIVVWTIFTIWP